MYIVSGTNHETSTMLSAPALTNAAETTPAQTNDDVIENAVSAEGCIEIKPLRYEKNRTFVETIS